MFRVYIAGPEVFSPHAKEIGERYKDICSLYNLDGLYPLDNEAYDHGSVFSGNLDMIEDADYIVANLEAFRGQCMDDGTAFEIGFAMANGDKSIIGYMPDDSTTLVEKYGEKDENGWAIEDFGLPINLMIYNACDHIVCGDFEKAIEYIAKELHLLED